MIGQETSAPPSVLALRNVGRSLCSTDQFPQALQRTLRETTDLLEAESSALILLDEADQTLYFTAVQDSRLGAAQRLVGVSFPADRGIAGWTLRHGHPVAVTDVARDARFYDGMDVRTGTRTSSYLCVPLRARARPLGVLTAVNKRAGVFGEPDIAVTEVVASQLAIALERARLTGELRPAPEPGPGTAAPTRRPPRPPELIGTSPQMNDVYRLVERIVTQTTTVLVSGETGTGKEVVARAIHARGRHRGGPFVPVNCAAIPEPLLEAELFGYERGAFTGAAQRKPGRFELAAGGTLFLDEIGEMSLHAQAKLLRVLQDKRFERLGGTSTLTVDTRIIAATNRDLRRLVREGRFREDLYYRLTVYPIPLPPLRERTDDLLPLARHFLERAAREHGWEAIELSPEAQDLLVSHDWPGNVRELENVVERAALLCDGPLVAAEHLPAEVRASLPYGPTGRQAGISAARPGLPAIEKQCITEALAQVSHNKSRAARVLGLSRTQLRTRMRRHGLAESPVPPARMLGSPPPPALAR